ncbi:MAG TPA: asparaginase [Pyrinomonadaceae bacterium]|nr:asparaginase [Pyrinomonadaceae bacterium]
MSTKRENIPQPAPLVEVTRGQIIESRHRGHIIAVDAEGRVIARLGQPQVVTYLRSSAKPFQAVPLVNTGAATRFGFTEKEIAIACASHNGEAIHTETVSNMLKKIGLDQSALKCGVHEPFSAEVAEELRASGQSPTVLHNNCSGKHTGMLALALHLGAPVETYDRIDNPVQQAILRSVSEFSGAPRDKIALGVDGCGAPVFGVSVRAMALMYARLVTQPESFCDDLSRDAARRISRAMTTYPEIVGGRAERLDTKVMLAGKGAIVSKVGAEGVYTAGVLPSDTWPRGLGIAIKMEDGEDRRSRPTVVIETLRQLGILDAAAIEELAPYSRFPLRNHRGDEVGEVRARFELEKA